MGRIGLLAAVACCVAIANGASVGVSASTTSALFDSTTFGSVDAMIDGYAAWVRSSLAAETCEHRYLVWKPQAGIGDAAYSFAAALTHAVRASRMLFVDWTFPLGDSDNDNDGEMSWRDVVAPAYNWDWNENPCSKLLKADGTDPSVVFMIDMSFSSRNGHLVGEERAETSHPQLGLEPFEVAVLQQFFKPSTAVQEIMGPIEARLAGRYVISVHVRTGWTESTLASKFLDDGDEEQFLPCIVAAKQQLSPRLNAADTGIEYAGVTVLVFSDNNAVLGRFRADPRLASSPSFEVIFGIDSTTDGSAALSHVNRNSSSVRRDGVYRSFAEWGLLGRSQVAFSTSNSLFGDSGTKRGGEALVRRYAINKGSCASDSRMWCKQRMETEPTALHESCRAFLQSKPQDRRNNYDPWLPAAAATTRTEEL